MKTPQFTKQKSNSEKNQYRLDITWFFNCRLSDAENSLVPRQLRENKSLMLIKSSENHW